MIRRIVPGLLLCLLGLLGLPQTGRADEKDAGAKLLASGDVRVRVTTGPAASVLVGSRAFVRLEFLTKSFFKGAPDLPDLAARHAIVRRESSTAVNGSVRIDGEAYASQMWEYAVYPQRAGPIRIPALDVVLRVAGEDGEVIEVAARTPHAVLEARLPPGAEDLAFVIGAASLTVTLRREPEASAFEVGGAFRRTVTLRVEGAPAMLIAPLPTPAFEGVAIYADAPRVDDHAERGDLRGVREESTAYVMEQAGTYELPAVRIPWWNTETQTLETAVVPGFSFTVAGGAAASGRAAGTPNEDATDAPSTDGRGPWGALIGLGAALLLLWFLRHAIRGWLVRLRAWRTRRADAEPARFRAFAHACSEGDPAKARRALQHWLDAFGDARRPATVAGLLAMAQDPELEREVGALDDRLYGTTPARGAWSGAMLATRSAIARRRMAQRGRESRRARATTERLNPPRSLG